MNKTRILYAEDETDLRELTHELLTVEGFDCVSVKDGLEAQQAMLHSKFDILLTDFYMPHLDGANLLFWCRKNQFQLPIIFITGSPERLPTQQRALKDVCTSLVNKPFNYKDLLDAIEQAHQQRRLFAQRGKVSTTETEDRFLGQLTLD